MYPGHAQTGLVLPGQLPLISTWLSFHHPTVELHPCLARSPRGCSVTTEGPLEWHFQMAVAPHHICTQIYRLSKRFSPRMCLLPSFSPAPLQPHPEWSNERTNNPQNKVKRQTVIRQQLQQVPLLSRFSSFSFIFYFSFLLSFFPSFSMEVFWFVCLFACFFLNVLWLSYR